MRNLQLLIVLSLSCIHEISLKHTSGLSVNVGFYSTTTGRLALVSRIRIRNKCPHLFQCPRHGLQRQFTTPLNARYDRGGLES